MAASRNVQENATISVLSFWLPPHSKACPTRITRHGHDIDPGKNLSGRPGISPSMDFIPSEPQPSVHTMQAYINEIQTIDDTNRERFGDMRGVHSKYSALNKDPSHRTGSAEPPTVRSRILHGPVQSRELEKAGEQDPMNSPPTTPRFTPRAGSHNQEQQATSPLRAAGPNLHIAQIPFRTSVEKQSSSQGSGYSPFHSSQKGSVSSVASADSPATSLSLQTTSHVQGDLSKHEATPTQPFDDFDLAAPVVAADQRHTPEALLEMLFSPEHLRSIFEDQSALESFAAFIRISRPQSLPLLTYYLDMTKVAKAVEYANALASAIYPVSQYEFTSTAPRTIVNDDIEEKTAKAFQAIARNDLPQYITHRFSKELEAIMINRVTGSADAVIDGVADGLTEVFCLTDPSREDNPVVFASQAFCEITQYGLSYIVGRNCRFLQGPATSASCTKRIKQSVDAGEPHSELILNYRRDGSPFLNLLMHAPLRDSSGKVRYFLGAQVDISNLAQDSVVPQKNQEQSQDKPDQEAQTKFQKTTQELRTLQKQIQNGSDAEHKEIQFLSALWNGHLAIPPGTKHQPSQKNMIGFYEHYLLIRPHPSLRILFVSPSLQTPDILQTPVINYIRGSPPVRDKLVQALADGQSVSAKVRWITRTDEAGKIRWMAFTPLLGGNGKIGVWVAVFVDNDGSGSDRTKQTERPIHFNISDAAPAVLERTKNTPIPRKPPREILEEEERPMTPDSIRTNVATTPYEPSGTDASSIPPLPSLPRSSSESSAPSLEERLRKKRAREAARMQAGIESPSYQTYKSLSPFVPE